MENQSSFRKCISVDGADIRHSLPDGLNGAGHPTNIMSILSPKQKCYLALSMLRVKLDVVHPLQHVQLQ